MHQRRADNIFLTISLLPHPPTHNTTRKKAKKSNMLRTTDYKQKKLLSSVEFIFHSEVMHFHKVTHLSPPPHQDKKKLKDVLDDKLPSRNIVVDCTYLSFGSPAILPNVKFWSFHLLRGASDGWITFS